MVYDAIYRLNLTLNQNVSVKHDLRSGYDLPVIGLSSGEFFQIHILALSCILSSFICVIVVLVISFNNKEQKASTFFQWPKSERFVVYIAICDGFFNLCHSMDHLHILITRNHVYPKQLCEFYGLMLIEFILAQNLMVNVVAINAFVLIFFSKKMYFGTFDWKLLAWMFGIPFLAGIIALALGTLGPNGTFCYFDGIKGNVAQLFFTTIPLTLIIIMNIIFYAFIWFKLRKEEPQFKTLTGENAKVIRASHRAARNMCLFIAAFLVQWFPLGVLGLWKSCSDPNIPILLFNCIISFSNLGGVLNGIVYLVIRRRNTTGKGINLHLNKVNFRTPPPE